MVDFLTNSFVRVDGVESRDDVAGCSWRHQVSWKSWQKVMVQICNIHESGSLYKSYL